MVITDGKIMLPELVLKSLCNSFTWMLLSLYVPTKPAPVFMWCTTMQAETVLHGLTPEEVLNGISGEEVFARSKNPITKEVREAENKSMRCCLSKK